MKQYKTCCIQDPAQYQWYEKTLQVSTSIDDTGAGINTNLLWSLLLSWFVVYACIVKGIKSSGKVSENKRTKGVKLLDVSVALFIMLQKLLYELQTTTSISGLLSFVTN